MWKYGERFGEEIWKLKFAANKVVGFRVEENEKIKNIKSWPKD